MITIAALLTFAAAAPVQAGPPPALEDVKWAAEAKIRSMLVDPASAQFEWPYEMELAKNGNYWTCGRYNARNRMGGYSGFDWFSVAVRDGKIVSLQSAEDAPWIIRDCVKPEAKGGLHPRG